MKLRRNLQPIKGPIDIAPLVDVVLLLLIFFMLTSSFVFQPGIQVNLPEGSASGGISTRYIIAISAQNPPLIFFNDQLTSLEKLQSQLQKISKVETNASIVLKADKNVPHGLVTEVMNIIVQADLPMLIATQPVPEPGVSKSPQSTPPQEKKP